MEIAFELKALREICEDEGKAKQSLGVTVTEMLRGRLADLRAADHLADIIVGNPRIISKEPSQEFAVDLCEGFRMVFCANHKKVALTSAGDIDWSKVSRIRVLRIDSEHN